VRVERGDPTDLPAFHQLYAETAERDGFVPRGRDYFGRMWAGLSADDPRRIRLYLARQGDELAAATLYIAVGAAVYDLRGITDTLDPDDPHVGLLRFKVGTGGQAVVTLGEWDLPINRTLHRAFRTYLDRRS
jgi:lipid II:glycine glycyltransferase (peptidoglycan interpeptide bridge formation enzyme)